MHMIEAKKTDHSDMEMIELNDLEVGQISGGRIPRVDPSMFRLIRWLRRG